MKRGRKAKVAPSKAPGDKLAGDAPPSVWNVAHAIAALREVLELNQPELTPKGKFAQGLGCRMREGQITPKRCVEDALSTIGSWIAEASAEEIRHLADVIARGMERREEYGGAYGPSPAHRSAYASHKLASLAAAKLLRGLPGPAALIAGSPRDLAAEVHALPAEDRDAHFRRELGPVEVDESDEVADQRRRAEAESKRARKLVRESFGGSPRKGRPKKRPN